MQLFKVYIDKLVMQFFLTDDAGFTGLNLLLFWNSTTDCSLLCLNVHLMHKRDDPLH